MELDQLRSFVAVAEARSFTRAASLVHLSQPAISRQIARLETELGAKLFERYGRRVECTADGRLLLPLARNILARADDASRIDQRALGDALEQCQSWFHGDGLRSSPGPHSGVVYQDISPRFISTWPRERTFS